MNPRDEAVPPPAPPARAPSTPWGVPVTVAGVVKRFTALLTAKGLRDAVIGLFVLQVAWVDVATFGDLMVGLAAGAIVTKVVECGLNSLLILRLGDPRQATREQVAAVNALKLALLVLALGGLWVFTGAMGYAPTLRATVLLVGLGLGLGSLVDSLYLVLRMRGRQVAELAIKAAAATTSVALCAIGLRLGFARLAGAVFLVESVLAFGATVVLLGRGRRIADLLRGARANARGLAAATAPFGLLSVAAILYNKSNVFFLERLHGAAAVARYSASWLVVDWVSVMVSAHLLAGVLFPLMSSWRHEDGRRLRAVTSLAWVWLVLLAWPTALLLHGLRTELIGLFFPHAYSGAAALQVVLVWTIPAAVSANVLQYALLAAGRQWAMLGLMTLTLAASLALNVALVPGRGAAGAALAITLSKATLAGLTLVYAGFVLRMVRPRDVALALALGATLWASYALVRRLLPPEAAAILAVVAYAAGLAWLHRRSSLLVAPVAVTARLAPASAA